MTKAGFAELYVPEALLCMVAGLLRCRHSYLPRVARTGPVLIACVSTVSPCQALFCVLIQSTRLDWHDQFLPVTHKLVEIGQGPHLVIGETRI